MPAFGRILRSLVRRFGFDIARYTPAQSSDRRRMRILETSAPSLVLDVGANMGQYARDLRHLGYQGRIVSFEPTAAAFAGLSREAAKDDLWDCRQVAVGTCEATMTMYVAANSTSSSFLPMKQRHLDAAPNSAYLGIEEVRVTSLDALQAELLQPDDRVWLKLDVQGYELQVLLGARNTLKQVHAIEVELSLVPLYEGQALYRELLNYMDDLGFNLVFLEPGFTDPDSGHVLQVDAILIRCE